MKMLAAAVVCALTGWAVAQDYIGRLNAPFDRIPASERSTDAVVQGLLSMDEPPASVADPEYAQLLTPGMAAWSAASEWASASGQQAMVEALDAAAELVGNQIQVFTLPYGPQAVSPDQLAAGVYVDFGDPPLLAAARFRYLEKLDAVRALTHIEATRLLNEGDPEAAVNLLLDAATFGRQIANRQFGDESIYGFKMVIEMLERVRDIMYLDYEGARVMEPEALREVIRRVNPERSALNLDRFIFPQGDRLRGEQMVNLVYGSGSTVDEEAFGRVMSRLTADLNPLRLFSEGPRWAELARRQGRRTDALAEAEKVFLDWANRWGFDDLDDQLNQPFYFDIIDEEEFAAAKAAYSNIEPLYELRRALKVELVGTEAAAAVVGYMYEMTGAIPPVLTATRPAWLSRLRIDPYNSRPETGAAAALQYFLPGRSRTGSVRLEVFPESGQNFEFTLADGDFVLYSAGPNGVPDYAERVSNDPNAILGDYIIWPPMISLERIHLEELGVLR